METQITVKKGWFKKRVGLRFDLLAWSMLYTKYKVDINNIKNETLDFELKQIHCAAISYAIEHKQNIWFDMSDVKKWVLRMLATDANEIRKVITESSLVIAELQKEVSKSQVKKK